MRKSRPRKVSKSPRKKLVRKLDSVFSAYIRQRDQRCATCPQTQNLTNGHLFSRASYSTRWDEQNCHAQCSGCNYRHEFDPVPFHKFFIRQFGQYAFDELYRKYRETKKFSNSDLVELIEKYEELI